MNILFIASDNNRYSGAFLSMVKLTSLLKYKYHHNLLVVLPRKGSGKELLDAEGIENTFVRSYTWTIAINEQDQFLQKLKSFVKSVITEDNVTKLIKLIERNKIDLVHLNTSWTYIDALAAIKTNTPFIWHIREFLEEDQGRMFRKQNKAYALMRRANKIVTISNSLFKKYAPVLGKDKLVVIYNGIDPLKYMNKNHLIFVQNKVKFLMVGNLNNESKGQWLAINACIKLLRKGYTNFQLQLVGEGRGPYFDRLKKIVSDAQAEEYIIFCGLSNDMSFYYSNSDIFLMCSKAETFGRVTVEAMLAGCLVIGAKNAGTLDLIEDELTGLLYESGNVDNLVEKIEFALDNKDKMKYIAHEGQQYMLKNMTADINAEKINTLYREIIGGAWYKLPRNVSLHVFASERMACA